MVSTKDKAISSVPETKMLKLPPHSIDGGRCTAGRIAEWDGAPQPFMTALRSAQPE